MFQERQIGPFVDGQMRPVERFTDWKTVPIVECGQPLVPLDAALSEKFQFQPEYFLQGIQGAKPDMFLREEAAERLKHAADLLPGGFTFVLYDAHRPLEVQQSLFDSFLRQLAQERADLDAESLIKETQKYVSLPSDNPIRPSPHFTGGSIDLSIVDENQRLLEMGSGFDYFGPESKSDFYRNAQDASGSMYHRNRMLLYEAMTQSGFTNYPEEWWHFDFGNQFWGKSSNRIAKYSGIPQDEVR